ncbi:MAG: class I SAM-dependent methyltransferase, partial [Clostridiales bacterium]|nr:class I SAM-dependent methyltransferase [Clostridiales bacterium]
MEKYIEGNKEAWEEAFDKRDESWGADITERINNEDYPFFNDETRTILKNTDTEGKVIGQFCCNNGRELLSLVKCGKASKGVGFDIAENQVAFANEKARELGLPCVFEAANIYDIDDSYKESFDMLLITIGALCWFDDLDRFFAVAAKCMKPGALIIINEQH